MEVRDRGARLKQTADRSKVEPFSFMAEDGTFSNTPDLHARISLADRFLSNFHKPLQRRMLLTKPEDPMPSTCVMRHDITGQVYIVGQERYDTDGSSAYERLHVLHLVSNESSVFTNVIKYQKADDAKDTDMVLAPKDLGKFHISLEYQSSRTEKYSDGEQSSRMIFYASARLLSVADEMCEFEYNHKTWSIKQVFYDSGFASGVLIDSGQNIDTYHIVEPANTYDPTLGTWDFMKDAVLVPFSASLAEEEGDTSITSKYGSYCSKVLYVKAQFEYSNNFRQGMIIQFPDKKTYRIDRIRNNRRSPDVQLMLSRISAPKVVPDGRPEDGKY